VSICQGTGANICTDIANENRVSLYCNVQRDATMSSQYFILLHYHFTCFGCPLHQSSGVQETVVAATGIGYISR
jgi:hypothetical protein